jgi:thiamine pyrophosphokinase
MHCLIVAGGDIASLSLAEGVGAYDMLVCADGGAHNAMRLGLRPEIVVGDLDSLDAHEKERLQAAGCRFVVHPRAKDETDLELALLFARSEGARTITIIGALGNRPDHTLANLMLMTDVRFSDIDIRISAAGWEIWIVRTSLTVVGKAGDTVSLLPVTARVAGVETDGLEYPLRGETLLRGPARGVSNVMLGDKAQVRLRHGVLIVMHGRGKY